jgi:type VI secretion system secreted protein VgrG
VYEVVIEPWITLAGRTSDFKIFQNKSALDIVREVLGVMSAVRISFLAKFQPRFFKVQPRGAGF